MHAVAPHRRLVTAVLALVVVVAGCSSDDSTPDAEDEADVVVVPSVTVPAERLSPFCQAMIELSDRLETDPPDDVTALIVETYSEIADDVPAEIADDFLTVLARLQAGPAAPPPVTTSGDGVAPVTDAFGDTVPGTDDPLPDEGFLPSDDPAGRLNDYVQFACRDSQNNPGPPPTQPAPELPDDTAG